MSKCRAELTGKVTTDNNNNNSKNVRVHMGRCPVRSIFSDALEVLMKRQHLFG